MTLYGEKKETMNCVLQIPYLLQDMEADSRTGHWSFSRPGVEKKWYGTHTYKPKRWMGSCPWGHERGSLRSKAGGKLSIRFCGDPDTVEVILRTIIQLSVCGGVACLWRRGFLIVQKVQGDLELRTNQRSWLYQQFCRQRPNHFWPMSRCKETCCENINENSLIFRWSSIDQSVLRCRFHKDCCWKRSWQNWIVLIHVEKTHYLEMTNYPK